MEGARMGVMTISSPTSQQLVPSNTPFLLAGNFIWEVSGLKSLTYQIDSGETKSLPFNLEWVPIKDPPIYGVEEARFSQSIQISGASELNSSQMITVTATWNSGDTSTASVTVLFDPYKTIFTSQYWNVWAQESFVSANQSFLSSTAAATAFGWLDLFTTQIITDFGFSVFNLPSFKSYDGVHMDCVLDPTVPAALTPTVFGRGVSIGPSYLVSSDLFDWYRYTLHETANQFTASIASGWIWANGSPVWAGQSDFPNICEIVVSNEVANNPNISASLQQAYASVSPTQFSSQISTTASATAPISDDLLSYIRPEVALYLYIQQTYGWSPFQQLFALVKSIQNFSWSSYPDTPANPQRTALTCALLSQYCGLEQSDPTLLNLFNEVTYFLTQTTITPVYAHAQTLIPNLESMGASG
jgi:hypothetical protein